MLEEKESPKVKGLAEGEASSPSSVVALGILFSMISSVPVVYNAQSSGARSASSLLLFIGGKLGKYWFLYTLG